MAKKTAVGESYSSVIFKQQSMLVYNCKYLQCIVNKTRKYLATVQCRLSPLEMVCQGQS